VAYRVENIEQALAAMRAKGLTLIDEQPRPGARNARVAFLHPKSTKGVLIEFVEPQDSAHS
jgi:methylmalonyl-CoA/ethylmalonyl-CoA epimerase